MCNLIVTQYKYIVMGVVSSNPSTRYLAHITKGSHTIYMLKWIHGYNKENERDRVVEKTMWRAFSS